MSNRFPHELGLCVSRNDREYRQLVKQLDRLVDEVGEDESHPLASMMEVLGVLIENSNSNSWRNWRR